MAPHLKMVMPQPTVIDILHIPRRTLSTLHQKMDIGHDIGRAPNTFPNQGACCNVSCYHYGDRTIYDTFTDAWHVVQSTDPLVDSDEEEGGDGYTREDYGMFLPLRFTNKYLTGLSMQSSV
jgi:hypothetical protein